MLLMINLLQNGTMTCPGFALLGSKKSLVFLQTTRLTTGWKGKRDGKNALKRNTNPVVERRNGRPLCHFPFHAAPIFLWAFVTFFA